MTLAQHYKTLRNRLWLRRGKLPLLLIPASLLALWIAVPFAIRGGLLYLVLCALCSAWGFFLRSRAISSIIAHTRKLPEAGQSSHFHFITEGIYGRMRYPLYVANFLIWFGVILYVGVSWFIVGATLLYAVSYLMILSREEELLLLKYGEAYRSWCEQTPALIPRRKPLHYQPIKSSPFTVMRGEFRHIAGITMVFLLFTLVKQRLITYSWSDSLHTLLALGIVSLLFLGGRLLARQKKG